MVARKASSPAAKRSAQSSSQKRATPADSDSRTPEDSRVSALLRALEADPEHALVVQEFEERAQAADGGRKFGSNGLKVNGKLFALFTQGTLVLKLPKARVLVLTASEVGRPFDPGHGRLMKEWLAITSPNASWVALTREAYAFVEGSRS